MLDEIRKQELLNEEKQILKSILILKLFPKVLPYITIMLCSIIFLFCFIIYKNFEAQKFAVKKYFDYEKRMSVIATQSAVMDSGNGNINNANINNSRG